MSRRKGFEKLLEKYWDGDHERFSEWFTHCGRMAADPAPQNYAWQRWEATFPLPEYAREALNRLRRREGE